MHKDSIAFRSLDKVREALATFREGEDEVVRKEADALARSLRDSEGNLEGVAATLAMGVRPILPGLNSSRADFMAELLKDVPEATDSRQSMIDSLRELSLGFDRYHNAEGTTEVESDELSLVEIRNELEDCDELCRMYGDLFALIQQESHPQDEWTKRLEIKNQSVLTEIIERETVSKRSPERSPEPLSPVDSPKTNVADEVSTEISKTSSVEESWPEIPVLPTEDASDPNEMPAPQPEDEANVPPAVQDGGGLGTTGNPAQEPTSVKVEEPPAATDFAAPTETIAVGGKCADVVFVIDASGSMRTCFDQLRANIRKFVEPFREEGFDSLRLGLLAYSANIDRTVKKCIYRNIVIGGEGVPAMKALYGSVPPREGLFFTQSKDGAVDTEAFMRRLDGIRCKGDEDTVFALDCAADFPYGPLESTRRVMVLFTDEKIEDGVLKQESVGENFSQLEKVMKKIVDRHISLYAFAPASPVTDMIAEFSRVFLTVVPEFSPEAKETWTHVDFARVLEMMGKSVSSSLSGGNEQNFNRAVFGQNSWGDDRWA